MIQSQMIIFVTGIPPLTNNYLRNRQDMPRFPFIYVARIGLCYIGFWSYRSAPEREA